MFEDILREVGLTEGEAKVYLALNKVGTSRVGTIIRESGISSSKTYEILDKLMVKGLVSLSVVNEVKHFSAASPDKILYYLERKEKGLEETKGKVMKIIPKLVLESKSDIGQVAKIYLGLEGIKTVTSQIISELKKGEEWLVLASNVENVPDSWWPYFENKQKERVKKRVKQRLIVNKKFKRVYKERKDLPLTEFRFLEEKEEIPVSFDLFGDKVALNVLSKDFVFVVVLDNKDISRSFRNYFESVWKKGKKSL